MPGPSAVDEAHEIAARGPSIQSESALRTKNGSSPRMRQRLLHAAAGFEQLRRARRRSRCAASRRPQVRLDLIGEVMDVDDRGLDAGLGQPVEDVVDQRSAADPHQRLRDGRR